MNKQLYRYYLVMALSFVVDSIISYYLPYNFDKLGITIVPCVSLMMFTLLNNTIGDEHQIHICNCDWTLLCDCLRK